MTLAMCAHIVFPANARRGELSLRKVHSVEINTSVHDVCQSATITLPRNIPDFRNNELKSLLRRGDEVRIYLGYDGVLREVDFAGFATSVGAAVPVVIECRDGLFKLLQQPFNKAYKNAHVPTMVKDLVGDAYKVQAMDAHIGPVRIEKARKADAFKALKDEFGLVTYLKGDTVYCGVLFDADARTVAYGIERNVKSSDLKYRTADEVSLKVTAKSVQVNGDKALSVEVGDPDGESRTLHYYGIPSEGELKKLATADLEKFKFDGYEGGFKAFGIPFCQYGDKVQLSSSDHPERDGQYLAEAVTVSFGPDGFERHIKLAQQWIA
ncbi:MAG: hypothetical protein KIT10_14605 [Flavobacteriales bacterium]|nr:hypothetical protein [Flavobacteriales bacterium]